MMKDLLIKRTKRIGIEVILLIDLLPSKPSAWELAKQIVRKFYIRWSELPRGLPCEIDCRFHKQTQNSGRRSRRNRLLARGVGRKQLA